MNKLDVEIKKRERMQPVATYPYHVEPLTEQAILAFAHYGHKKGSIKELRYIVEDNQALKMKPFMDEYTFYYDDPEETEEQRIAIVTEQAIWSMAQSFVPGITHMYSDRRTFYVSLRKDVDYRVVVGEKALHEQPVKLSFDDINKL